MKASTFTVCTNNFNLYAAPRSIWTDLICGICLCFPQLERTLPTTMKMPQMDPLLSVLSTKKDLSPQAIHLLVSSVDSPCTPRPILTFPLERRSCFHTRLGSRTDSGSTRCVAVSITEIAMQILIHIMVLREVKCPVFTAESTMLLLVNAAEASTSMENAGVRE